MEKNPNRRQWVNLLPDPKFQLKYVGILVATSAIPVLATCGILGYFLRENYVLLIKYGALDPGLTQALMRELELLLLGVGGTFLLFLSGIAFMGVVFSHRIAGVIYAIKRSCAEICQGNKVKLKLRRYDEFQELADSFNKMVDTIDVSKAENKQSA